MKKVLYLLLVFLLVGCVEIKKNPAPEPKEVKKEKYSLVSSDDRLVFKEDNNYEIVYYEDFKIVKVEIAIKFDSEEEAMKHYKIESTRISEGIKYVDDTYIAEQDIDYWEDYKDLNKDELKNYFEKAGYEFIEGGN